MSKYDFQGPPRLRSHRVWMSAYLLLLIVIYGFLAVTNFAGLMDERLHAFYLQENDKHPPWYLPVLATCQSLIVVGLAGVLRWRRIGVYTFIVASVAMAVAGYSVGEIPQAACISTATVILLILLWIGSPRSTWSQMD